MTPASCRLRKDIYGRDARMIEILKSSRGRDLETLVSHAQPSYARPSGSTLPSNVAFNDGYSRGPSFFERLFGGPPTPPARSAGAANSSSAAAAPGDHPLIGASRRFL